MSRINLVVLGGNLVRDPELRYTPAGTAICEFTIANSEKWKDKSGEMKEETGYFNCMCWGRRGEIINEYFAKGKAIQVQGKLKFQQWETKDGDKRNVIKINVLDFDFIGGKSEGAASNNASSNEPSFPGGNLPADVNEEEIPF
jgi:single-strand DNA-binding protein